MTGKKKEDCTAMLAARVAGVLGDRAAWPVTERDGAARDVRGGDVAVLCRGNAQVGKLAAALATHSIRVAVERYGPLDQPEIEFAFAAFRWIADASDTLALAELARLGSDDDRWFSAVFGEMPVPAWLRTFRVRMPSSRSATRFAAHSGGGP